MSKININWSKVGNAAKEIGGWVLTAGIMVGPYLMMKDSTTVKVRYIANAKYSDVISTVLNSGMLSSYKTEVMAMVPKNGDTELYKSIIAVVNSDMLSSSKVEVIKDICDRFIQTEES